MYPFQGEVFLSQEDEYRLENKKKLINNIFLIRDKVIYPADLSTKSYIIFYPTEGYHLSVKQYNSFMGALNKLELLEEVLNIDIEFIDSLGEIGKSEIRRISNFSYSDYESITLLFENCIIDEKLRWSICVYQDYWGIMYGSRELLHKISLEYNFREDLEKFKGEVIATVMNEEVRKEYEILLSLSYSLVKEHQEL